MGRLGIMELRHLRYFVAVAEELSVRRAAHRLHVSQPALSQQISDLEDELGIKLFTRNSRGVELTEAGRTFLIGGRRALVAVQQAAEEAQETAKGARGRLVIGSLGAATISFLSGVLSRFREKYPLVEVNLTHMHNRAQVEAVLDGSIMLGIGFYSYSLEEDEQEQVSTQLVLRSPVEIVAPKNRRFPKGTVPKLKDFRHDKFLSVAPDYSFGYEQWLRELCQRLGGFEPDIAALADSPDSLIGMVAAGRGVFLGPEVAIRGRLGPWTSAGNFYLLTEPESHFELFAIWKRQLRLEPTVSKFLEVLAADLGSPQVSEHENGAAMNRFTDNAPTIDISLKNGTDRNERSSRKGQEQRLE
jgi:LysR family transcriptional regulator, benzoate and cis,cis-muconate-responsive activator of ben and cat genes